MRHLLGLLIWISSSYALDYSQLLDTATPHQQMVTESTKSLMHADQRLEGEKVGRQEPDPMRLLHEAHGQSLDRPGPFSDPRRITHAKQMGPSKQGPETEPSLEDALWAKTGVDRMSTAQNAQEIPLFAARALMAAMSYDYVNRGLMQQMAMRHFTSKGWLSFMSLAREKQRRQVVSRAAVVKAIPLDAPNLIGGPNQQWHVSMPLLQSFYRGGKLRMKLTYNAEMLIIPGKHPGEWLIASLKLRQNLTSRTLTPRTPTPRARG